MWLLEILGAGFVNTYRTSAVIIALAAMLSTFTVAAPNLYPPNPEPVKASELLDDEFEGKYRAAVKTSAHRNASGNVVIDWEPATLGKMLDRLDKWDMNDTWMRDPKRYRWHHRVASVERVEEEQSNVKVRGWLRAIKYEFADGSSEGDNDFHLIVSNYKTQNAKQRFLNVEISGLPKTSGADKTVIRNTREQIADILGDVNIPKGKYYKPASPIRVEIEGSLYFDGSHHPGQVGPVGMRPVTVWEIHPVTSIVEVQ